MGREAEGADAPPLFSWLVAVVALVGFVALALILVLSVDNPLALLAGL